MVEQGKRVSCRWTYSRVGLVEDLGWENLSDGEILDKALEFAVDNI